VGSELKRALDQDRSLTYLQLHAEDLDWYIDTIRANASYQRQEEQRYRRRDDNRVDRQGVEVGTLGFWLQAESPSPLGRWTYGAEYYQDQVDSYNKTWNADGSFAADAIQGPVADDSQYHTVGVFLQDEFTLFERLTVTLGARYNYVYVYADKFEDPETGLEDNLEDHWDSFAASGRFLFRVDKDAHWNLFGGVSQGFRAPNLSDLTRLDTARTDEIETPAPGLDPEKFLSFEGGLRVRYEQVSGQLAYFFTDIEDMIVRTPTGDVVDGNNEVTKQNAGDGYVNGIEASARYRFHPQWALLGGATFLDGEVDTYPTSDPWVYREPIDRRMPVTGYGGLRWDHPDKKYWVEGVCVAATAADDLSTRDESDTQRIPPGGTPAYAIGNLRAGWELSKQVSLSAAVENLTNEDYRIHGSGQNEPGTNVVLGLDCKF
jgi:hemoglobin/transferrin/lactoferrin receptor protein